MEPGQSTRVLSLASRTRRNMYGGPQRAKLTYMVFASASASLCRRRRRAQSNQMLLLNSCLHISMRDQRLSS